MHRSSIIIISFLYFTVLPSLSSASEYPKKEHEAIGVFDHFCVGADGDIKLFKQLAIAAKAKPVSKEILNQDIAIATNGGLGYFIKKGKNKYMIVATNTGACSIVSKLDFDQVNEVLIKNYRLQKVHTEDSGPYIKYLYKLTGDSIYSGGVFSTTMIKPSFDNSRFITIGYISKRLAKKLHESR